MNAVACSLEADRAETIARMALAGVSREYPNQVALVLASDADARPPRELTPAFYGCYDWHSAVHSHWCLVRLTRCFRNAGWVNAAMDVLGTNLTESNLLAEVSYLNGPGREGFERPYGLAWLLQLSSELSEWVDPAAKVWLRNLEPLVALAVDRFSMWLDRLQFPIRSGEHSRSAFAMGLCWDYARSADDEAFAALIARLALDFHREDVNAPLRYEPSGHEFFSPCLAEADLLRRVLDQHEFATWLNSFQNRLDQLRLPDGYEMEFGGESAERNEAVGKLAGSVGVLAVIMVATLVLSFGSFRMAGIIDAVAVLSGGLGLGSLWLFGYPFGFMAIIGTMGLVGIAMNDSIVVLAALREDSGATARDALAIRDVVVRSSRHVFATTVTTIAGFIPLILEGGGFWPPLAITIAGGVTGATLLALVFVPSAFALAGHHVSATATDAREATISAPEPAIQSSRVLTPELVAAS